MDRLLPLKGVRNFRDFGGWDTNDQRRIRRGRLYRSGHFSGATEEDWAAIQALNVKTVADLRRITERERDPSAWPEHWDVRVLASEDPGMGEAPHITFLKEAEITEASTRGYMMGSYRRIPFEAGHQALFRGFFEAVRAGNGAAVAHCAAGKDRTGILCALVLQALGVSRETVMEDYLMTNEAVDVDRVLPVVAQRMNEKLGRNATPEALRPMIGVDADYLHAAFDEIEQQSGSVEVYLEDALGQDRAAIAGLKTSLLEE